MFVNPEYEEIFFDMLNDAFYQGLISHNEEFLNYIHNREDIENFYVMLLSIHSRAMKKIYDADEEVYKSSKVNTATNSDLDDIGALMNITRAPATKGSVVLRFFYKNTPTSTVEYPQGIVCSDKKGHNFITQDKLVFTPDNHYCEVLGLATQSGIRGKVKENTVTKIESDYNELSVNNPRPSFDGRPQMSDDDYRDLIRNWLRVNQRGNEYAYRNYFANLDGLFDYSLVPNWDGTGTIKCVLEPSTVDFMNKVWNDLQDNITQASEDIVLFKPLYASIDIFIHCNVSYDVINPYSENDLSVIKADMITATKEYFSNMKIGQDFIPFELGVYLKNNISKLKDLQFELPEKVVVLSDDERATLGNLNITIE